MLDSILTDFINRGKYNKATATFSVKNISQNIRMLAKELGFSKRYNKSIYKYTIYKIVLK